jgi:nitronate monooxygenase
MFLVSGPGLVIASCNAGVIGSFPTANCRTLDELDEWLNRIREVLDEGAAPYAVNLIVHLSNSRLQEDLALVVKHEPELVIASVGSPAPIIDAVHGYGGLVFADIASVRHARKAIEAGSDGLILLTAGAGGQTGQANPFAFVRGVRAFFDEPIVLAGGIADARALYAAAALGCDFAYMGTRFIATQESLAAQSYKQMIVDAELDDIKLTRAITGLETSMLIPSLVAAGLDPDNLPARDDIVIDKDINPDSPRRWKDVWSAGHSMQQVTNLPCVEELVATLARDYNAIDM